MSTSRISGTGLAAPQLASEIERFLSERSREGGDDAEPFEGR